MKRIIVSIETDACDSEGNEYPDPSYWHWDELVGGNTVFINSGPSS